MPRTAGSKIVPWLLVGVIALIAYGSLYPFNLKPDLLDGGVLRAFRELSWARAGRGDRISNVLLYLPLGFCLLLWLNTRMRRIPALVFSTLLGAVLSLAIEVSQVYISARVPSLTDLTLNALGTALGAIGGVAWRIGTLWMRLPQRVERPTRDSTAGLLIFLWVLWRFAPFIPHFDLAKLKAALRPLFNPHVNLALAFAYLTCWIVVTQALSSLVSRARLLEALLVLIAVVLTGRLLVADQAFVPSELVALIVLLPLIVVTDRLRPLPRKALLLVSVLAVFLGYRLAPFEFAGPRTAFDFWPFLAWLKEGVPSALRATDWSLLCGKLFLFGELLWVFKHCGASIRTAAVAMVALVIATEVLQLWLATETGSLTDPVLAIAVALSFYRVDRRAHRFAGVVGATPRLGRSP